MHGIFLRFDPAVIHLARAAVFQVVCGEYLLICALVRNADLVIGACYGNKVADNDDLIMLTLFGCAYPAERDNTLGVIVRTYPLESVP